MEKHTIFYDAECPICIREITLILEDNRAEYFKAVAIQGNEETLKQYGITAEDALTYLHILRNDGVMLGKMPAVRLMYRGFKGFALVKLANLPLLDRLADLIYPWFARNRYRFPAWLLPRPQCENGVCRINPLERNLKCKNCYSLCCCCLAPPLPPTTADCPNAPASSATTWKSPSSPCLARPTAKMPPCHRKK